MNPMPELTPMLKQLRLSRILDSLETRNRQAIDEKMAYTDFLGLILQDEIARRSQKRLALALRRANFRNQKTLEQFDFSFNPSINRSLITDLATCRFIIRSLGQSLCRMLSFRCVPTMKEKGAIPNTDNAPCSREIECAFYLFLRQILSAKTAPKL